MRTFSLLVFALVLIGGGMVFSGCERQAAAPRTATEEQDDEKITEQVRSALNSSPSFKFPDVQIASYKGNVQLSGFVATDEQKRAAEEMAKAVPGVVQVENKISIKP